MILLFWILIALLIGLPFLLSKFRIVNMEYDEGPAVSIGFGIAFAIIFFFFCLFNPIVNRQELAELQAFHNYNSQNYGITVDTTASYLSQEEFQNQLVSGSIEKINLASILSDRIMEWRDAVNEFNIHLARYKYYSTSSAFGLFYPSFPEDLKPLIIK